MSASYVLHSKCLAGGRKSTVLRVSTFFIVYMERGGYVDLNTGALKGQRHQTLAVLEMRCEPPDVGGAGDVSHWMWALESELSTEGTQRLSHLSSSKHEFGERRKTYNQREERRMGRNCGNKVNQMSTKSKVYTYGRISASSQEDKRNKGARLWERTKKGFSKTELWSLPWHLHGGWWGSEASSPDCHKTKDIRCLPLTKLRVNRSDFFHLGRNYVNPLCSADYPRLMRNYDRWLNLSSGNQKKAITN